MPNWTSLQQRYRGEINPLLEMLRHKQSKLPHLEWLDLVQKTEQHVINSPDQYLSELSEKVEMNLIIRHLFKEFVKESL